ncbi:type II toxin-antitoxin system HicB family antitoxin [Halopelagius longus]|uniref:Type II toxin-antitoxin system HicB family antitoxin n=1 Tax=Halopelagius longus TaxID=1236180 RepID=A0A1H0XP33_9EURY|nr:type II toxin-antitoxin system HicB family antitoxin [Halopelagius longus]RDI71979.1 type II toxin-antitoxin system HicB family antitoxin [Halopelagius longus]SDQ04591.1 hypothetical protein SAMN05216278_0049 [Halopelagius longus]
MSEAHTSDGEDHVILTYEDGIYVAEDPETGVASQGSTRPEALTNLAEAIELHLSPIPDDVEDDLEPSSAPWL